MIQKELHRHEFFEMLFVERGSLINRFKNDEIALANDTEFGLAAYVFTTNLANGLRAARDIQAGSVCVNEVHYIPYSFRTADSSRAVWAKTARATV